MQTNNYKRNLTGAACNTFLFVLLPLVQLNNKKGTLSTSTVVLLIALLGSAIFLWMRGTKQYIDHRLQEIEKGKQEA